MRVVLTAVLLAIGVSVACGRDPAPPTAESEAESAVPVAAEPAQRGSLRAVIRATGLVTPLPDAEFLVVAPEPARILEIPFAEGERVASGALLVRLDIPGADATVARYEADIARAQALLENTRATATRSKELFDRGFVSRRELETAESAVTDAQTELARAESAKRSAELALSRATVRAPFGGVIAVRLHNPGDIAQASVTDPILRLVDPDRLVVTASVSAADASRVLPGANARLTSLADVEPVRLTVSARPIATGGADATVRLAFAAPTTLTVDTRVDVEIDGEEHTNAVLVPADAIIANDTGVALMIASGATAVRRVVTTGLRDAERIEITSGLQAGDLVITRGHIGLADGAAISVVPAGP